MLDALLITRMQDEMTAALHQTDGEMEVEASADGLMALAMAQHRSNFDLWHEEDKARAPEATAAEIARVKKAIDLLNQRRNDLVEKMDVWLIERLEQNAAAALHSETPGLMIDRLSILALKIYHTRDEADRASATEEHRMRNVERLAVLEEQRDDLAGCLDLLWAEVLGGTRRFKLYRQMKMYNDPELNPAVYATGGQG
jgi:post-segregation antitoxin (ccd killing protein)